MKVELKSLGPNEEPHIVIYANEITPQLASIIQNLSTERQNIMAHQDEKSIIVNFKDIALLQSDGQKTIIYTQKSKLSSKKRLIDIEKTLNSDFMRISKFEIINLKFLQAVEPSFNGSMIIFLKTGEKTYISRKYLPQLKEYLGI